MRKNSIKNTRINGEVQKELSRIISREIKDPRISPMTSAKLPSMTPLRTRSFSFLRQIFSTRTITIRPPSNTGIGSRLKIPIFNENNANSDKNGSNPMDAVSAVT